MLLYFVLPLFVINFQYIYYKVIRWIANPQGSVQYCQKVLIVRQSHEELLRSCRHRPFVIVQETLFLSALVQSILDLLPQFYSNKRLKYPFRIRIQLTQKSLLSFAVNSKYCNYISSVFVLLLPLLLLFLLLLLLLLSLFILLLLLFILLLLLFILFLLFTLLLSLYLLFILLLLSLFVLLSLSIFLLLLFILLLLLFILLLLLYLLFILLLLLFILLLILVLLFLLFLLLLLFWFI